MSHLGRRGALDRTIVILVGDHGEQFGEHDLFEHGNSLYLPLLHVPLVIAFPANLPEGRRVSARVSIRDVPSTVLELIGIHDAAFPGRSLTRYWAESGSATEGAGEPIYSHVRGNAAVKPWYPTSHGDMQSLLDDRYHYIRLGNGREELYALERDPRELEDLSGTGEGRAILERFRAQLRAIGR